MLQGIRPPALGKIKRELGPPPCRRSPVICTRFPGACAIDWTDNFRGIVGDKDLAETAAFAASPDRRSLESNPAESHALSPSFPIC